MVRLPPTLATASLLLSAATPSPSQAIRNLQVIQDEQVIGPQTINGLNFIYATATSPDGKHVYTAAGLGSLTSSDNAVCTFSRDTEGLLTFVEAVFDNSDTNDPGTADGLYGSRDLVISPDGLHVYTAAFSEDKIGVLSRNPSTGALTFASVVVNGGGLPLLDGVNSLAMTPDGSALFATAMHDDAVTAFTRNPGTGQLTYSDSGVRGNGGVTGMDRPVSVAVSPDGRHVYVAAGANNNATGSDAISVFGWNSITGGLSFTASYFEGQLQGANTIDGLHWLSDVAVSPDGNHVYASGGIQISGTDTDWIAIFSRDQGTGELTWLSSIDFFQHDLYNARSQHETYVVVSPDNLRVFVTSASSAMVGFTRDPSTGALTFVDADGFYDYLSNGINLPRRFSLSPDGKHIYASGTASNAVSVFGPETPTIEILGVSAGRASLRIGRLNAGLPSRIEYGADLSALPGLHGFTPTTASYDWLAPVVGDGTRGFFRAGLE